MIAGIGERIVNGLSSGRPLKSAREISTLATRNRVVLNLEGLSAQIMQWGQYVAHEITQLSETMSESFGSVDYSNNWLVVFESKKKLS